MKTLSVFFLVIAELSRVFIGSAVASKEDPSADATCRARAWVRAPNLEPGQLLRGDVKVKLDGPCEEVSSYVLGLRFVERSWVKTRREGVMLPLNPMDDPGPLRPRIPKKSTVNNTVYENRPIGWDGWIYGQIISQSVWDQYENDMKNPSLWLMREEERVAFETKVPLSDENQRPGRDIVKFFSLLVPSTNYPPGFDFTSHIGRLPETDAADAEHIYQYFVDVTFSNGSHRQIEAGYTSFNTVTEAVARPESVNITVISDSNESCNTHPRISGEAKDGIKDKFTLEITFPNGRHFEQGSVNDIKISSHQVGPGLQRPLSIVFLYGDSKQTHRWAAKHAVDNETAEKLLGIGTMYHRELQPKIDDRFGQNRLDLAELPQFSQDGAVENGTAFSTESVNAEFGFPPQMYPSFDMYYQTSEVELIVGMSVRDVSNNGSQPDMTPDDEEDDWTPTLRRQPTYRRSNLVRATVPIFVHRKLQPPMTLSGVVHYLSPEARSPIFVDPSSVAQLQQMTVEDRDRLAPISQAKFMSYADGEVVKDRWTPRTGQYYVGDTWLRKVVRSEDRDMAQREGTLVIQA